MRKLIHLLAVVAVAPVAFAAPPVSNGLTSKELLKAKTTWNGAPIVVSGTASPEVQAMLVEIAPGSTTAWHKHPVNNYAYVLEGGLRVELEGGAFREFKAGDAFAEVVNTWHRGVNVGTSAVKLVVFYTGESGTPISIAKPKEAARATSPSSSKAQAPNAGARPAEPPVENQPRR